MAKHAPTTEELLKVIAEIRQIPDSVCGDLLESGVDQQIAADIKQSMERKVGDALICLRRALEVSELHREIIGETETGSAS